MKAIRKHFILPGSRKGALTVEAALVLPLFLCVLLSLTFFIKTVRTYEVIQHAISQAAEEMSSTGYLLEVTGLMGIHDTARDGMQNSAEIFKNHMDVVFDTLDDLNGFGGSGPQPGAEAAGYSPEESVRDAETVIEDFKNITEAADEITREPDKELKGIASMLALGAFEDIKTEVFIPVAKLYIKKYVAGTHVSADERLKSLGIRDGFSGLDFDGSSFFEDRSDNIEIVVRYSVELPIPFKFFDDPVIEQRAVTRAWLEGDEPRTGIETSSASDIWSLTNFQRGSAIRKLYKANLPDSFPVISKFEAGTATLIKSMDLTAQSYQNPSNTMDALTEYIDRIAGYKGQEEPWGRDELIIPASEIKNRELLLVIPENTLDPNVEQALRRSQAYAAGMGIKMQVIRYGIKKVGEQSDTGEKADMPPDTEE